MHCHFSFPVLYWLLKQEQRFLSGFPSWNERLSAPVFLFRLISCAGSKYGTPSILTPFSVYVTLPIEPRSVIPDGNWSPKLFSSVLVLFYNISVIVFSLKFSIFAASFRSIDFSENICYSVCRSW